MMLMAMSVPQQHTAANMYRSSVLWSSIITRAIKVIRILWAPAIILIEVYCSSEILLNIQQQRNQRM